MSDPRPLACRFLCRFQYVRLADKIEGMSDICLPSFLEARGALKTHRSTLWPRGLLREKTFAGTVFSARQRG